MVTDDGSDRHMVDYSDFSSLASALEAVERDRGYDEIVKPIMDQHRIHTAGRVDMFYLFFCSAATRMRGLHDSIVREIKHGNPHSTFSLLRQLAETVAVSFYVVDHPNYVHAIATDPRDRDAKTPKRRSVTAIVDHMDRTRSEQFRLVYGELCTITHFDAAALWAPFDPGEDRKFTWTSFPRFRGNQDMYAVGLLRELSQMVEAALEQMGLTMLGISHE